MPARCPRRCHESKGQVYCHHLHEVGISMECARSVSSCSKLECQVIFIPLISRRESQFFRALTFLSPSLHHVRMRSFVPLEVQFTLDFALVQTSSEVAARLRWYFLGKSLLRFNLGADLQYLPHF